MSNELWAVHAQGPDDIYPAYDRADAERHAAELNALPTPPGISVAAVVIPSPFAELEHWKGVAELEREHKLHLMPLVAPTDANLSAMRKAGLSIDGNNAYKRDLLDCVVGALAFGKQRQAPPPAGHWLERFYQIGQAEADERDQLRALLTAHPQASAGNPSYLCHHCSTPLMMHGQQIYCPKCARKQPQASAAQSAPAGEREAFEDKYPTAKSLVFEGGKYVKRHESRWQSDACEAINNMWRDFQAGAAWQRTQSAGVPDGWRLVPVEPTPEMVEAALRSEDASFDSRSIVVTDYRAMLAAAPAQPAAQGEVQRLRDWVACVERLPADKRDVMVYCADSDEHMVGSSIGGGLFLFATASHGEKVVCRPTHWRYIDESDKPALAARTGQEADHE